MPSLSGIAGHLDFVSCPSKFSINHVLFFMVPAHFNGDKPQIKINFLPSNVTKTHAKLFLNEKAIANLRLLTHFVLIKDLFRYEKIARKLFLRILAWINFMRWQSSYAIGYVRQGHRFKRTTNSTASWTVCDLDRIRFEASLNDLEWRMHWFMKILLKFFWYGLERQNCDIELELEVGVIPHYLVNYLLATIDFLWFLIN